MIRELRRTAQLLFNCFLKTVHLACKRLNCENNKGLVAYTFNDLNCIIMQHKELEFENLSVILARLVDAYLKCDTFKEGLYLENLSEME